MAPIKLKSATLEADHITAETEFATLRLEDVACDGYGHYAVRWDAGDRWLAGEFVDMEDEPQLYEISDEDREFRGEDGEIWLTVRQSDGGCKWVRSDDA